MKKIESAETKVSVSDLKKALTVKSGVRAGLLSVGIGGGECPGCGLGGGLGPVKVVSHG